MKIHAPSSPAQPFAIGLKPLADDNFLILDENFPLYLAEKQSLYADQFNNVFMAKDDTLTAQTHVFTMVLDCLKKHHYEHFDFNENQVHLKSSPQPLFRPEEWTNAPLAAAALCIQDDLVLMRKSRDGWYLAAASLCFPSSWNLAEKFGRPMRDIHSPVPLEQKMVDRIDRIFDNLRPETPVWRANWSLANDGELRHDRREHHRTETLNQLSEEIWFRSEYQTLHKLPNMTDILFTIRIVTNTLADFRQELDGAKKIARLAHQYERMSIEEKRYKGIDKGAKHLLKWMNENGR